LVSRSSVSSPVAIRMIFTALPITSAGRFSPQWALGIRRYPLSLYGKNATSHGLDIRDHNRRYRDAFRLKLGDNLPDGSLTAAKKRLIVQKLPANPIYFHGQSIAAFC
jgi:hypothetical protein